MQVPPWQCRIGGRHLGQRVPGNRQRHIHARTAARARRIVKIGYEIGSSSTWVEALPYHAVAYALAALLASESVDCPPVRRTSEEQVQNNGGLHVLELGAAAS